MYELLVILRIYCVGIAFIIYCKYNKKDNYNTIIGALIYTFSGYIMYAAVRHPYFVNPIIMLPLVLLGIDKILKEDKIKVVENVFKGRISDEIVGFLTLIIQKDRYGEAEAILEYFLNQVKEYKGIGVAYVKTAVALTEIQKKQIEERLLHTTKYRQMEMHFSEDKSLIGGMVIRIGDRVVDSSISTKLDELEKQLMKIQLG